MRKIIIWVYFAVAALLFTFGLGFSFISIPKVLVSFWNTWFLVGMIYASSYSSFIGIVYKNSLALAFLIGGASAWIFFHPRALLRLFVSVKKPIAMFCIPLVMAAATMSQIVAILFLAGWMSSGEFSHYNGLKPWWFACLLGFCLYVIIVKDMFVFFAKKANKKVKT